MVMIKRWIYSLREMMRRWVLEKETHWKGWRRGVVRALPVFFAGFGDLRRNRGLERAATLSFVTLLSLVPLCVLFFSFAGMMGGGERVIAYVENEVFPMVAPEFHEQMRTWLRENISPTAFREGSAGVVNVIAVGGLLAAALGLLVTAERVFNDVWRVRRHRTYVQKAGAFWILLTTSPLLLGASMAIGSWLVPRGGTMHQLIQDYWILRTVYDFFVPFVVGTLGFTLVYRLLPHTNVPWRSAFIGGITAAFLWETSKRAFFLYVTQATTVTGFYGKLATLPLFLVWIYITWLLILIGLEMSYAHRNLASLLRYHGQVTAGPTFSRRYTGFVTMEELVRLHEDGGPGLEPTAFALRADLPAEVVVDTVRDLLDACYVIENAESPQHYVLGRHPKRIALVELHHELTMRDFPAEAVALRAGTAGPARTLLQSARQAALEVFGDRTAEDLVDAPDRSWRELDLDAVETA